jgi:diguanylate cyclase (GGDEF)-like protein
VTITGVVHPESLPRTAIHPGVAPWRDTPRAHTATVETQRVVALQAPPRGLASATTLLERVQLLVGTSLFSGVHPEHLVDLAAETQLVTFQPGEYIVRQGDVCDDLFVVVEGTVQAVRRSERDGNVTETVLRWLSAGDAIGELAAFDGLPCRTSFVTLVTTECLRIRRELVLHELGLRWPLAQAFVRSLVNRVVRAEARLAELDCDPLTGLSSRHAAAQFYERHVALCRRAAHAAAAVGRVDTRSNAAVAVVVVTVDNFLALGEAHGRSAAEDVLCSVAAALSSAASRTTDLVARYGLADFIAILPNAGAAGATVVLDRIRQALREKSPAVPFSVRTGFSTANVASAEPLNDLVARAGAA